MWLQRTCRPNGMRSLAKRSDARPSDSRVLFPVPCATPMAHFAAAVDPASLDEGVRGNKAAMSSKWRNRHIGLLHKGLPIVTAKAVRRLCHEAGRCICCREALATYLFACRLQTAFTAARKAMGGKTFPAVCKGGHMVCKFEWQDTKHGCRYAQTHHTITAVMNSTSKEPLRN